MIRPVLLTTLVVCSLGVSFVAVQPAAGDILSETPTPDDSDDSDDTERESADDGTSEGSDGTEHTSDSDERDADDEDDDRWYDRWESDRENRSDQRTDDEADDGGGANGTTGGDEQNASTAGDDADGYGDANESDDGRDDDADDSARDAEAENWSYVVSRRVRILTDESVEWVTDRASGDVDGYRGPGSGPLSDGVQALGIGGHPDASDGGPDEGAPAVGDRDLRTDDRAAAPGGPDRDAGPEPAVRTTPESDEPTAGDGGDNGGDGGDNGDDGEAPEPPSGAGAGAALFVTVGCLGGSRVAVTQASLLASPGVDGTLASVRRVAGEHLAGLPDRVVPPVFGYSRHDASDPLENETRAAIYDLVCESPGIYHARLAEETGVAVETVRYHCRILAEEGLVEPRKHRGKRRLYPVTMDDDDPDLAAAIADSAAADVLSAIERLEPATLSAVAEHVDCAPSTVAYHLDRLEEDGLVSRERDGGAVQVRLRRSTRSALDGTVADD